MHFASRLAIGHTRRKVDTLMHDHRSDRAMFS